MILPTAYLPSVGWYKSFLQEDSKIEIYESFPKQTARNRCRIAGPNGIQMLSVPVCKCEHKQLTKDVEISYQTKWQHQHWQALVSAYNNTPFFIYYQDFFFPFYQKQFRFLIDLNEQLIDTIQTLINPKNIKTINYTSTFEDNTTQTPPFLPKPYYQIFAQNQSFTPDLSIVDLLFNMGQESILYL